MSWREKAAKISKGPHDPVPKVTKPPSGTFDTDPGRHSESFHGAAASSPLTPEERAWFDGYAVACVNCRHFTSKDGPVGQCRRYGTEAFATPVFDCRGYWPADSALVDLARRRHKVADQLRADPALRYSFDVQGATPAGPASGPVSVMLGVRMADGSIVAAELHIPGDRWPGLAAFAEHWRKAAEGAPS